MTKFASRLSGVAMIALAALPALALVSTGATAQAAQPLARIAVGDLNSPSAARDFDARLNAEAARVCDAYQSGSKTGTRLRLSNATCIEAIRSEALEQLSPNSRAAVQMAAQSDGVRVAGR